jgi:hypothetical protein
MNAFQKAFERLRIASPHFVRQPPGKSVHPY